MAFIKWDETDNRWKKAVNPDIVPPVFNNLPIADPVQPLDTANKQYVDAIPNVNNLVWTSVPHASLTFSASGALTWTVTAGNLSYFKYARIGKVLFIKGAIVGTTIGGVADAGLRVSAPPGLTYGTNDSFGMCITSNDGFATQDMGQAIGRASGNYLEFRKRAATNWTPVTNQAGVIFNLVVELV